MEDPTLVIPASLPAYPNSWFREPFLFLAAMFCSLYGLPKCSSFRAQWVPAAHHIFLTGDSFNCAQILSCNLWDKIEKYKKPPTNRKRIFICLGSWWMHSMHLLLSWHWISIGTRNPHPCIYIGSICGKITSFLGFMSRVNYFLGQCISKFSRLMLLRSLNVLGH